MAVPTYEYLSFTLSPEEGPTVDLNKFSITGWRLIEIAVFSDGDRAGRIRYIMERQRRATNPKEEDDADK